MPMFPDIDICPCCHDHCDILHYEGDFLVDENGEEY
jgi:hypothetical protein